MEEAIASIVGARVVEGEIARLGAVSAALSAGEPLRALQLATRYRANASSDGARAKLDSLPQEAEAEVERALDDEPGVEPIRFVVSAG